MVQAVESPALAHGIEGRVDMMTSAYPWVIIQVIHVQFAFSQPSLEISLIPVGCTPYDVVSIWLTDHSNRIFVCSFPSFLRHRCCLTSNDRYGFWLGFLPSINSTSLIGSPINQTIQSLVIEPPVVSVSAVANLAYPTINFTLPLQIDMIMRFGNDLKIESYDATLSCRYFMELYG